MERDRSRPKRPEGSRHEGEPGPDPKASGPPKQIYLRTVYPLNPGIPHFIDVPGAW